MNHIQDKILMSSRCSTILCVLLFISNAGWSSAQAAPQLTVNGNESVSVTFEEERGQLLLFSGGNMVSITDSDNMMNLTEAILILEPGGDSSMESLRLNTSALPQGVVPQSNYQSEQGLLIITGDYTAVEYESILSAVDYVSTNKNPDDTMTSVVTCRVQDTSNLWSNNLTVTITIMAFNDPPVIYLGGSSQLNYSVTLPDMGSAGLPITTQVQFQDPDTTRIQSVQIVLELQTTNGDMVDLNQESLISPTGSLQQDPINRNVYNLDSLGTSPHSSFVVALSQVGYKNLNPSVVVPGTRVVRVTAMDVELVTSAGSRLPGIMSQPSFTFIHVGDEPPAPTTSTDSTEQQAQPTTTEIDTTSTSTITIVAPQLTVNGNESVSVTFEEERGQLPLFSGGNMVSITDSDSMMNLTEAILILEPGGDSSMESLRLNTSALPQGVVPQSNYQSEQGLLIITGDYTAVEYESILSAVDYVSTNKNPDDTMTSAVTCRVQDISNLWSNNLTVTINIMAFNDPPVIYLGGSSQLNYSVTLPDMGSAGWPITTQVQFQDPDTTRIQSVQIVLELQTTNGEMVDLNQESLISPTGSLQQDPINRNVYNLDSLGTSPHSSFVVALSQVGYKNLNPSVVVPGTRVVRVMAMDIELVTSAGLRLPGIISQPSFTFIHVGDEPPAPADSTTTTAYATTTPDDQILMCPEELNLPLIPGSTLGLLVYNWTKTPVEEDHLGQPCPMVCEDLAGFVGTKRGEVRRRCTTIVRDGREEAEWSTVDVSECGLSITALQLCENSLNMQSSHTEADIEAAVMLTDVVVNVTSQSEQLDPSAIAVTTSLVESLTQTAIQQPEIRESYLRVIDNIFSADQDAILEGQVQVNSSARLLESLRVFSENATIGAPDANSSSNASRYSENFVIYAFDNFGLILEDVDGENFTGEAFSVDLGPVKEAIQSSGGIDEDSLVRMASALPNATAAVIVPKSLFDSDTTYQNTNLNYDNTGNETVGLTNNASVYTHRLIFSVFLQNSLFQNQQTDCSEKGIGSVIVSFQINSSVYKLANTSIKINFQENREVCEDNEIPEVDEPICSIFQVESNAIRYSSKDCQLISSEGGVAKCECSQPGHFGLLFDLKPGVPFLPKVLKIASYIGACLSIICLLLVLIIYLSSRDLRTTKRGHQGQLVINISCALLGLYIVFILSDHVTSVRPLCGLMAALLQFFILAYFAWTAVEALLLLFKLVLPFHKFEKYFVLRAAIFAWLIPLVIVAVSVGLGHNYYINDFYCRSFDKPFYYGTILPALLLYIFNWTIFAIILCSFIYKHLRMSANDADSAYPSNRKKFKTYFTLIVALSIFFGLGWGFGLAATSSDIQELTFVFQLLFCIFVGSQGILVFILHCIRPQHMRKKWKSWCKRFTKCCGLSCLNCCRQSLTEMHPKSQSSHSNGFSAHNNNHHNVIATIPPPITLENHRNDTIDMVNGQSSPALYELIQSAPHCTQMNNSSKSYDNPSYVSISPTKRARIQTLPQASVAAITDRASKRKVFPLESNPNTEILDLND